MPQPPCCSVLSIALAIFFPKNWSRAGAEPAAAPRAEATSANAALSLAALASAPQRSAAGCSSMLALTTNHLLPAPATPGSAAQGGRGGQARPAPSSTIVPTRLRPTCPSRSRAQASQDPSRKDPNVVINSNRIPVSTCAPPHARAHQAQRSRARGAAREQKRRLQLELAGGY